MLAASSVVLREDDNTWPQKSVIGKQELEVRLGKSHISFETAKIGSLVDVQSSEDPEGMRVFYYLIQDLRVCLHNLVCIMMATGTQLIQLSKMFVFSLISLHFKIKPVITPLPKDAIPKANKLFAYKTP